MARIARIDVPGFPLHVTERGNGRQPTLFDDGDYGSCLTWMGQWCDECGLAIGVYCLIPNHLPLTACPSEETALS